MSRALAAALFFGTVTLVAGLVHYYFWTRYVRNTALAPPWRQIVTWLILVLAAGLPLSFIIVRTLVPGLRQAVSFPVYTWMGLAFILFVFFLGADLLRLADWAAGRMRQGRSPNVDLQRRVLLSRLAAGVVTVGAVAAAGLAMHRALTLVIIRRLQITLSRLPRELDGLTLVQLTDLHVGETLGREWVQGIVDRVNELKPDLVVITGDLVDGSVDMNSQVVDPLSGLRAQHGVFFVTGNHEYYAGVEPWLTHLRRLGIRVLRNERVSIGNGDASFDLAGIDDHHGARIAAGHGPDLKRALAGRDPRRELVLLAHQPVAIHEASSSGVGLQLSGHTHGGQIWPMNYLVGLQQPYIAGLVRHGPTQLYVSEGTGFWGPPMRLGTTSEITHITLRAT